MISWDALGESERYVLIYFEQTNSLKRVMGTIRPLKKNWHIFFNRPIVTRTMVLCIFVMRWYINKYTYNSIYVNGMVVISKCITELYIMIITPGCQVNGILFFRFRDSLAEK